MNHPLEAPFPMLTPLDRLRSFAAVALCAAAVLILGELALLVPGDPLGAVSVLSCKLGWMIIPTCAALAFVLAAGAVWLTDARLEELGVFAVCVALGLAAMPQGTAAYLWEAHGQGIADQRARLAWQLLIESLGWVLVVCAAAAGCRFAAQRMAAPRTLPDHRIEIGRGMLTVLIMVGIGALLIPVLSSGTQLTLINKGQVYFTCIATGYIAAVIAYQLSGAHSPLWAVLGTATLVLAGYAYCAWSPTPHYPGRIVDHIVQLPPNSFGRALPVQAIPVTMAAAIFGNWHQRQLTRYADAEAQRLAPP